ncbi:MAG: hypothetical protein JNN28_08335, partial [Saprospiraceae bacterium]|nr:hypothetical protein [Saprospiraceae bacterium]
MKMIKNLFSTYKIQLLPVFMLLCFGLNAQTVVTFTSAAGVVNIPDATYNGTQASMTTKTIAVAGIPAGAIVSNVRVTVNGLNHTWAGDLAIKLWTPANNVVGLMSRPGLAEAVDGAGTCCGTSVDFIGCNLRFDDAALLDVEAINANMAGNQDRRPNKGIMVSPYSTLANVAAAVSNGAANGNWILGIGDGAGGDVGNYNSVTIEITYANACALVCPANLNYNLDPGFCSQVVNYDVFTTGVCQIVTQSCGFIGSLAPAEVDFWQNNNASGTGLPAAGNSGGGNPSIAFQDAGAACPATADRLVLRSVVQVGGFCFTGVEWDLNNAAATTIEFDWVYDASASGNAWDRFAVGIGTDANHFGNNNNNFCVNPNGYWQGLTNQFGPLVVAGHHVANMPAQSWLSLAAWTTVAVGVPPATITISNLTSTQIVPAVPVQYAGLPSGSEFPIGSTTNCFRVDLAPANNPAGDLTCCFNVNVIEYPNPIASLVCNDLVYVSLDEDCSYCLGADGVLEGGPYHCYDDYI